MNSNTTFRWLTLLLAILAGAGAYFFSSLTGEPWPFGPAVSIALAVFSALCFWFSVRGHLRRDKIVLTWAFISGVVGGGLGLIIGVFACLYLWPHSNLAPICAFFVSGPYSFVGAVAFGILLGFVATRKKRGSQSFRCGFRTASRLTL